MNAEQFKQQASEKAFHSHVKAVAKKLYNTELLFTTSCVMCDCGNMLHAVVGARAPMLKVTCPKCKKLVHRVILSDKFINDNLFNLARDIVINEINSARQKMSLEHQAQAEANRVSELTVQDEYSIENFKSSGDQEDLEKFQE